MHANPMNNPSHEGWQGPPTLEYSTPHALRPGVLTAVGIISIVLGGLGILGGLWKVISLVGMLVISQMNFQIGPVGGGLTPAGSITAEDADVIVRALSALQALSPADQTRLAAALQQADIPLAPPPAGEPWSQQQVAAQVTGTSGGLSVTYMIGGGTIQVDPAQIQFVAGGGGGFSTTTIGTSGQVTSFNMGSNPFGALRAGPLIASFATEVVNLGLAVMLLVAGIATLRASARSPALHRWWAWLKLVVIPIATAVGIWQAYSFMSGFAMTTTQTTGGMTVTAPVIGAGPLAWMMIIPSVLVAMIACIYPIAVLIVFRTRTVREYYRNEMGL